VLGGEQRLLFLHKARKGRAYVSDQRDGLLYVKRVTYEQLVYREKGQVSDLSTFIKNIIVHICCFCRSMDQTSTCTLPRSYMYVAAKNSD
jgi:hypothetical protein